MEEKKKNPFLRFLAFLLTAALLLGAVFLIANWRKLNFDFFRRWYAYRSLAKNESGQVESYRYIGGSGSSFLQLGEDLLVSSESGVRLYSPAGTAYVDQPCVFSHPFVAAGGNTALVYDAGGSDLFVYRDREQVFSYTASGGHSILYASLSAQGQLVLVTQASGLKGEVTVYNSSFEPLYGLKISSRFVTGAELSPDGKTLALATSGQTGGIYDSQIGFYGFPRAAEDTEPDAVCSLGNNATLRLSWASEPLRVLGENALSFVSPDGTLAGSYSYDRRVLKGYCLEGNACTLLLGKYRAGTSADLVVVDAAGEELASQDMDQQVLSMSSAGRYLSVLTADGLTIYSGALEPYHTTADLQGARRVLQREDGSVTLISGETARLYLPN